VEKEHWVWNRELHEWKLDPTGELCVSCGKYKGKVQYNGECTRCNKERMQRISDNLHNLMERGR
jgi:hypothetical protein